MESDKGVRWRDLAAQAVVAATRLTDPEAKRLLFEIAAAYERLAQRAEKREKDPDSEKAP